MSAAEKIYGVADRAWQVVVGCDPKMPCAPRCWARKTVARIVKCQEKKTPERAAFFQLALTPDGSKWSGHTVLDEAHIYDPLRWKIPALIATGFHGDWGRLHPNEMIKVLQVVGVAPRHDFMLLSKQPHLILDALRERRWRHPGCAPRDFLVPVILGDEHRQGHVPPSHYATDPRFLPNATLGCSVMNQWEADKYRPAMAALSALGWRTHVWYEPAIGPVNWKGWEFLERIICGGETANAGFRARPFKDNWAYTTLDWCRNNGVKFWMKQMGQNPVNSTGQSRKSELIDRKGESFLSLPELLRVREEVENCK
jgi:protein gp37